MSEFFETWALYAGVVGAGMLGFWLLTCFMRWLSDMIGHVPATALFFLTVCGLIAFAEVSHSAVLDCDSPLTAAEEAQ